MALEKVYDYFHHYDKQTYRVVASMGNEPSEQDIKKFENQYGTNLPADFREFTMSPLGGLYMEVREEIWPRAKQYDIGPFLSTRNMARYKPSQVKRRRDFQKAVSPGRMRSRGDGTISKHKCAVCGQTEMDNPDLEFRFCSKCNGNYEYCQNHLFSHTHVK